jgi:hypothetical protein
MADTSTVPTVARHGAHRLVALDIDGYNVELKDNEGYNAPVAIMFQGGPFATNTSTKNYRAGGRGTFTTAHRS